MLPPFGALHATIQAHSDAAYRRLIGRGCGVLPRSAQPALGEQFVLKEIVSSPQLVSGSLAQATAERI
jgi:hypothetical protein